MSFIAGMLLSRVALTMAQSESQLFFVLSSFREQGNPSMFKEMHAMSSIECCVDCVKNVTCRAANFHSDNKLCELIEPGIALMSPEASTGWTFYYSNSIYLEHFFNAVASQSTTYVGAEAALAIDGDTNSNFILGSCTHTIPPSRPDVWWMVDLWAEFYVERVTLWNRVDCYQCYLKLSDLTITVSETLEGVDDPANVCGTYPGPPSSASDNPVTVTCTQGMLGRYVKIAKQGNTFLHICEFDFA